MPLSFPNKLMLQTHILLPHIWKKPFPTWKNMGVIHWCFVLIITNNHNKETQQKPTVPNATRVTHPYGGCWTTPSKKNPRDKKTSQKGTSRWRPGLEKRSKNNDKHNVICWATMWDMCKDVCTCCWTFSTFNTAIELYSILKHIKIIKLARAGSTRCFLLLKFSLSESESLGKNISPRNTFKVPLRFKVLTHQIEGQKAYKLGPKRMFVIYMEEPWHGAFSRSSPL